MAFAFEKSSHPRLERAAPAATPKRERLEAKKETLLAPLVENVRLLQPLTRWMREHQWDEEAGPALAKLDAIVKDIEMRKPEAKRRLDARIDLEKQRQALEDSLPEELRDNPLDVEKAEWERLREVHKDTLDKIDALELMVHEQEMSPDMTLLAETRRALDGFRANAEAVNTIRKYPASALKTLNVLLTRSKRREPLTEDDLVSLDISAFGVSFVVKEDAYRRIEQALPKEEKTNGLYMGGPFVLMLDKSNQSRSMREDLGRVVFGLHTLTNQDIHRHEWGHIGLDPLETMISEDPLLVFRDRIRMYVRLREMKGKKKKAAAAALSLEKKRLLDSSAYTTAVRNEFLAELHAFRARVPGCKTYVDALTNPVEWATAEHRMIQLAHTMNEDGQDLHLWDSVFGMQLLEKSKTLVPLFDEQIRHVRGALWLANKIDGEDGLDFMEAACLIIPFGKMSRLRSCLDFQYGKARVHAAESRDPLVHVKDKSL